MLKKDKNFSFREKVTFLLANRHSNLSLGKEISRAFHYAQYKYSNFASMQRWEHRSAQFNSRVTRNSTIRMRQDFAKTRRNLLNASEDNGALRKDSAISEGLWRCRWKGERIVVNSHSSSRRIDVSAQISAV